MFRKLAWLTLQLLSCCASTEEISLLEKRPSLDADVVVPVHDAGFREGGTILPSARDAAIAEPPVVDAAVPSTESAPYLRYDFSGHGTEVQDRSGFRHARIVGDAQLDGSGRLTLDGNDYVDMPNGTLSRLTDASIVVWFEWSGGNCWHRVFDFGSNDGGEERVGRAITSLFFTPSTCPEERGLLMVELGGRQGTLQAGTIQPGRLVQIAFTYNSRTRDVRLFQDGAWVDAGTAAFTLGQINDVNSWLGRSQWVQDQNARIRYDELRIYDRALSPNEIMRLARLGPNVL